MLGGVGQGDIHANHKFCLDRRVGRWCLVLRGWLSEKGVVGLQCQIGHQWQLQRGEGTPTGMTGFVLLGGFLWVDYGGLSYVVATNG